MHTISTHFDPPLIRLDTTTTKSLVTTVSSPPHPPPPLSPDITSTPILSMDHINATTVSPPIAIESPPPQQQQQHHSKDDTNDLLFNHSTLLSQTNNNNNNTRSWSPSLSPSLPPPLAKKPKLDSTSPPPPHIDNHHLTDTQAPAFSCVGIAEDQMDIDLPTLQVQPDHQPHLTSTEQLHPDSDDHNQHHVTHEPLSVQEIVPLDECKNPTDLDNPQLGQCKDSLHQDQKLLMDQCKDHSADQSNEPENLENDPMAQPKDHPTDQNEEVNNLNVDIVTELEHHQNEDSVDQNNNITDEPTTSIFPATHVNGNLSSSPITKPAVTQPVPALNQITSPAFSASSPPYSNPVRPLSPPPLVSGIVGQHRMPGSAGNTSTHTTTITSPTAPAFAAGSTLYTPTSPSYSQQLPLPSSQGTPSDRLLIDTSSNSAYTRPITTMQYKHLLYAIRSTKRLKDAGPFLAPVDWKALNIPDYPLIITNPVDLSVIESKIHARKYTCVDSIMSDFNLMVDNCVRYNGDKSPYVTMAISVRKSFGRHLEKLPSHDEVPPAGTAKKSNSRRRSGTDKYVTQSITSPGSRKSVTSVALPLPSSTAVAAGSSIRERTDKLDVALSVVRELFRKHHAEYAGPFLAPVDRQLYPMYYESIKTPMDFGTIRERLESGHFYQSALSVEQDALQVFKNCIKFNPVGNPIRQAGMRLENVFKNLWATRMAQLTQPSQPLTPSAQSFHASSSTTTTNNKKSRSSKSQVVSSRSTGAMPGFESDSDSDDGDQVAIQSMERTIADLQRQLDGMKDRRRDRKRKRRNARESAATIAVAPSTAGGQSSRRTATTGSSSSNRSKPRAPRQTNPNVAQAKNPSIPKPYQSGYSNNPSRSSSSSKPVPPEVTFDMKRELSERINDLPGDRLQEVLNIIQETMGTAVDGSEEIELDINLMDNGTVYRLWKLVTDTTISSSTELPKLPVPPTLMSSSSSSAVASSIQQQQQHLNPDESSVSTGPTSVSTRGPPQPLGTKFMSLSAALGPNSSDEDGSDDESSSGSDSD